jgi:hypothetical protein
MSASPEEIQAEAERLYPWAFEPGCHMEEDEQRKKKGQGPRNWEPTREFARSCVRARLNQ